MLREEFNKDVDVMSTISHKSLKEIKIHILKNYLKYFFEEESNVLNMTCIKLKKIINKILDI